MTGLPGWGFAIGSEFQMHSWRLFILVCLFPALAALVGVIFMPESPRFLLEVRSSVARLKHTNLKYVILLSSSALLSVLLIQDQRYTLPIFKCIVSVSTLNIRLWLVKNVESSATTATSHCCAKVAKGCYLFLIQDIVRPLTTCGIVFVCYSAAAPTCLYHTPPKLSHISPPDRRQTSWEYCYSTASGYSAHGN